MTKREKLSAAYGAARERCQDAESIVDTAKRDAAATYRVLREISEKIEKMDEAKRRRRTHACSRD